MSPLGSIFQSGCPRHRKFISGYAEGHDMLYKHDSLGGKKSRPLRVGYWKSRCCVAWSIFIDALYWYTGVSRCVLLADEDKVICPYWQTELSLFNLYVYSCNVYWQPPFALEYTLWTIYLTTCKRKCSFWPVIMVERKITHKDCNLFF